MGSLLNGAELVWKDEKVLEMGGGEGAQPGECI